MKLVYLIAFLSLGLLCALPSLRSITVFLCIGVAVYYVLIKFNCERKLYYINKKKLFPDIVVAALLVIDFIKRWEPSSKAVIVAQTLHLPTKCLLYGVAVFLAILAFLAIDYLIGAWECLVKVDRLAKKYMALMIVSILEYWSIEVSAGFYVSTVLYSSVLTNTVNICIIFLLNLLLLWVVQKAEIAMGLAALFFFLWSFINYYTICFHGSPLFPDELVNTKTALEVASNYSYSFSANILCIIFYTLLEVYVIIAASGTIKVSIGRRVKVRLLVTLLLFGIVISLYDRVMERYQEWMPWEIKVGECGFINSAIENLTNMLNPYRIPEGYQVASIQEPLYENETKKREYPDIIFILNETFCDLEYYTDLSPDSNYMEDFYNLPGALYGYAVAPNVGGGTNNSEFELLMSKSMYLLGSGAPFTYLRESVAGRNIVSVLESQGYTTMAMHCENGANYNRDKAYPALGFDNVLLGSESFAYSGSYGNRFWLDSDNYKDMIYQYNKMGESPRFMYLLTMQNHGGYEQNDDSYDTVHTQKDFGNITDDVNEFLTSIQFSAKAFKSLIDYFKKVDRPVIICMVGDHAPAFINELPEKAEVKVSNRSINMRAVPYVIWANFDMDIDMYTEYASMVDLVPMVLKAAGLPISTFYNIILQLHEILPIRTSDGIYMDRDYHVFPYEYEKHDVVNDFLTRYYYMEYNSLLGEEEYLADLFTVH